MVRKSTLFRLVNANYLPMVLAAVVTAALIKQFDWSPNGYAQVPVAPAVTNNSEPTPTPTKGVVTLTAEGKRYTDRNLGFSVDFPADWHLLEWPGWKDGACFGANPGEVVFNTPQVCVDLRPWVTYAVDQLPSRTAEAQQTFFTNLLIRPVGVPTEEGAFIVTVSRHLDLYDAPAVEFVRTNNPGLEGHGGSGYGVEIYIDHPNRGLLRFSMAAQDEAQFEEFESTLRQILASVAVQSW